MKKALTVPVLLFFIVSASAQIELDYTQLATDFNQRMDNLTLATGPQQFSPNTGKPLTRDPYLVTAALKEEYGSLLDALQRGNQEIADQKFTLIFETLQGLVGEFELSFSNSDIVTMMGGNRLNYVLTQKIGADGTLAPLEIPRASITDAPPSTEATAPPFLLVGLLVVVVLAAVGMLLLFGRGKGPVFSILTLLSLLILMPLTPATLQATFLEAKIVDKTDGIGSDGTVYLDILSQDCDNPPGSCIPTPVNVPLELQVRFRNTSTAGEIINNAALHFATRTGILKDYGIGNQYISGITLLPGAEWADTIDIDSVQPFSPSGFYVIETRVEISSGANISTWWAPEIEVVNPSGLWTILNNTATFPGTPNPDGDPLNDFMVGETVPIQFEYENDAAATLPVEQLYATYTTFARDWTRSIPSVAKIGYQPVQDGSYTEGGTFIPPSRINLPVGGLLPGSTHIYTPPSAVAPAPGDCWSYVWEHLPFDSGNPADQIGLYDFGRQFGVRVEGPDADIIYIIPDKLYFTPLDTTLEFKFGIGTYCAYDPYDDDVFDSSLPLVLDLYYIYADGTIKEFKGIDLVAANSGPIRENGDAAKLLSDPTSLETDITVTSVFDSFHEMLGIQQLTAIIRYDPSNAVFEGVPFSIPAMENTGPGTQRTDYFGGDPEGRYIGAFGYQSVFVQVPRLITVNDPVFGPSQEIIVPVIPGNPFDLNVTINNPFTDASHEYGISSPYPNLVQTPGPVSVPAGDSSSWGSVDTNITLRAPIDGTPSVQIFATETNSPSVTDFFTVYFDYLDAEFDVIVDCVHCNVHPGQDANVVVYVQNPGIAQTFTIIVGYNNFPLYTVTELIPANSNGNLHYIEIPKEGIAQGGTLEVRAIIPSGAQDIEYRTITVLSQTSVDETTPLLIVMVLLSVLILARKK